MEQEEIGHVPESGTSHAQTKNLEWRRFFRMHPWLKRWGSTIVVSALTSLAILTIVGGIGWMQRERIAAVLLETLPPPAPLAAATTPVSTSDATPGITEQASKELSVTEVVAKANPSVVSIEVQTQGSLFPRTVGKGSGFFVSSDGLVITNRHVIDFANPSISVTTTAGKKYSATLVSKDPVYDLAVLRVVGSGFPAATLGSSEKLVLGESVVAIGFALGQFENSISVGVISGLSRSIVASGGGSAEQLDRVIQTDAAINPGNSGGPLINMRGEVIGVNVAVAEGSQSVGFAIPSKSVQEVVNSVKTYGTIVRPYVGISYGQIDTAVQRANNLPVDYGVYVQTVVPETPASRAGLQPGDIILSIDGTKLDGEPSFAGVIRGKKVGQTVTMAILRSGIQSSINVTLVRAPEL